MTNRLIKVGARVKFISGLFIDVVGTITEIQDSEFAVVKVDAGQVQYSRYGDVWCCSTHPDDMEIINSNHAEDNVISLEDYRSKNNA